MLRLTFLGSKTDTTPERDWQDVTEDDADKLFGEHRQSFTKDSHGFAPARFDICDSSCVVGNPPIGKRHRADKHVLAVTALVVDLDSNPDLEAIQAGHLHYWMYSTHSHDPSSGKFKFRLVFPFAKPLSGISVTDWKVLYKELCKRLSITNYDTTCENISRIFYLPACIPGRSVAKLKNQGDLLDACSVWQEIQAARDAELAKQAEAPLATIHPIKPGLYEGLPKVMFSRLSNEPRTEPWTVEEIRDEIAKFAASRARNSAKVQLYNVLKAARDGTKFATSPAQPQEPGVETGRDAALHRLISCLAQGLNGIPPWEMVFEALRPMFLATDLEPEGWDEWHAEAEEMYARRVKSRIMLGDTRRNEIITTLAKEAKPEQDDPIDMSWMGQLIMTGENGDKLDGCGENIQTILANAWGNRGIWFDAVRKKIRIDKGPGKGLEPKVAATALSNWFYSTFKIKVPSGIIREQLYLAACVNTHDDLAIYLRGLVWDGVPRLATWLKTYAGASDEGTAEYLAQVGSKWLIACVSRALDPGCKVDTVLVLEGRGGIRKSTLFKILGGQWFTDAAINVENKDSLLYCSTQWILELAELTGIRKGDVEAIKQFLSVTEDTFRVPYGDQNEKFPRRVVFGATVNPKNNNSYLMGDLGERRIWIVPCDRNVDFVKLIADRDQLWAEAVHVYLAAASCDQCTPIRCTTHRWWFEIEDWQNFNSITESRKVSESDIFEQAISEWWYKHAPANRPKALRVYDVAKHALEIPAERCKTAEQMKIADALKNLGFSKKITRLDGKQGSFWVPGGKLLGVKKGHLETVESDEPQDVSVEDPFDDVSFDKEEP